MPPVRFDELLEAIDRLSPDEQADLLEIARRRLSQRGRRRVIEETREARAEFKRGEAGPASVDRLIDEIGS